MKVVKRRINFPPPCAKKYGVQIFSALLAALFLLPVESIGDSIRVGGTGTSLGTMEIMAAAFMRKHPEDTITVLPSIGSGGAIKAVLAGTIGIGFSSRPLHEKEVEKGALQYTYGRTPFVVAVSSRNPVRDISKLQLADIWSGKTTTWKNGQKIRLVLRSEGEADTQFLRSMSPLMNQAVDIAHGKEGMLYVFTDQENAQTIETVPGAIGTSTIAQILSEKRQLTALSMDNVGPTPENIVNGTYPFAKTLRMVTSSTPPPLAKRLMDFVSSDEGKNILRNNGHLVEEVFSN